jgi:lipoprotein-releasing system permease protein
MPFELQIALRYLLAKRRQVFISVISAISTLGVAVGVMTLLVALAIMTGVQGELRARILGSAAHVSVFHVATGAIEDYREVVGKVRAVQHVTGAAPVHYGKALVTAGGGSGLAVVKGIDPMLEPTVTRFGENMVAGSISALSPVNGNGRSFSRRGIVLGHQLAGSLGVVVGDEVSVITPEGPLGPGGTVPRTWRFEVVGLFRAGLYDFDTGWALVDLRAAQRFFGFGDTAAYVEIQVDDIYRARLIADDLRRALGKDYGALDWMEMNESLFSALWLEKMVTGIFISFIIGVAALNIIATLIMIVMEKTRDIAILRSMGASARSIMTVFVVQGTLIGLVGTAAGAIIGVGLCRFLDHYRLIRIPEEVYQVAYVPFKLLPLDFALVVVGAPLVCFLATIYPARRASGLNPSEALRYE